MVWGEPADRDRYRRGERDRACGVRALAKEGYRVAVADRDKRGADEVAHHIDGHAFEVDVADEASVIALFDARWTCSAGRSTRSRRRPGSPHDAVHGPHRRDVSPRQRLNVVGTFLCIREAAKRMSPGGRICTVASVAGKRGGGLSGTAAYAASKGGVLALSRSAARALAPNGIAVNCVAPGPTLTPMLDDAFRNAEHRERVEGLTLLGRSGAPARSPRRSRGSCRRGRPSSTVRR